MGKSLVIVESPAKAKTINRYLGDDFVVKSSVGHVRDLPTGSSRTPSDPKERARQAAIEEEEARLKAEYETKRQQELDEARRLAEEREAERLADRVGIIHQGKILMVEKKDKILEKLGDKRVIITINKTSKNLKKILTKYNYQKKKNKLIFSLDLKNNKNSVSDLFKDLIKNSISFNDVEIKKNNLEEIFLKLIDQ